VRSIGLDFDNTLVDYTDVFRAEAAGFGLDTQDLDKTQIRDRLRARGPEGEIAWQKVQARVYGPGLTAAPMMAGSAEFLRRCAEDGARLAVVSHKGRFAAQDPGGTDLREAARLWLRRHCPEIATDRVFFEDERAAKLRRIASLGLTHFVDDLPEVLGDPDFPREVARLWLMTEAGQERPSGLLAAGPWPVLARSVFGG
jgi:hypothetical protein